MCIIKICTFCRRIHRYRIGDRLPHWGDLTIVERIDLSRIDARYHHTICPDCRAKIRERDSRLRPEAMNGIQKD